MEPEYARLRDQEYVKDSPGIFIQGAVDDLARNPVIAERTQQRIAARMASNTESFNRGKFIQDIQRAVGISLRDVIKKDGVTFQVEQSIERNIGLIKSIPEQYHAKLKGIIQTGMDSGNDAFSIRKQIFELGQSTERRAATIARDQVAKLNSAVNQARQRSIGVTHYFWRTSRDERVRKTHRRNEGKRFAWNDPPATGHPGEDYNCRCSPDPDLSTLMEELGAPEFRRTTPPRATAAFERQAIRAAALAARQARARRRRFTVAEERETIRRPRSGVPVRLNQRQRTADRNARTVAANLDQVERVAIERQRDYLMWNWVHGSNRKGSLLLKEVIQAVFPTTGIVFNKHNRPIDSKTARKFKRAARATYEKVQRELKRRGVRTVKLYRGVGGETPIRGVLESWTTDPDVARKFGKRVMVKEVPIEKIFNYSGSSQWVEGIWGEQKEYLVIQ
jgi:SPP1 gp7 family putative phage head morphogenesis protein